MKKIFILFAILALVLSQASAQKTKKASSAAGSKNQTIQEQPQETPIESNSIANCPFHALQQQGKETLQKVADYLKLDEAVSYAHNQYQTYKVPLQEYLHPHIEKYDKTDLALVWTVVVLVLTFLSSILIKSLKFARKNGVIAPVKEYLFRKVRKVPFVKRKIQMELDKTLKTLEEEVNKMRTEKMHRIPATGIKAKKIMEKLDKWNTRDSEFRNNKHVTGCMYAREDEEAIELIKEYTKNYLYANPLHFEIFPSAMQMEAEVISMTAGLYNGTQDTCGILTSGGTESILLACLAYREYARERGIKEPEMVIPETAHAAFYKACWYFGIRLVKVDCSFETGTVLVKKLKAAINKNTCMVAVSFPNYPNGNYDDVETIAAYCLSKNVPLHVDCCLGGFLAPFAENCGVKIPKFDFRLPAVTSISCDHHKYGLAPKGVSVVMFKNKHYRSHCMYALTSWSGGIYATPGLSGSRGGAASAGAWIAMCYFGYAGYRERAEAVFRAQEKFVAAIKQVPELKLVGEPKLGTVAISSNTKKMNIYSVHDLMLKKGWHLNATQKPSAMQFLFNYCNIQFVDNLIKDMKECVNKCMSDPSLNVDNKWASLYATAAKLPTSLVEEGSKVAIESFLKI